MDIAELGYSVDSSDLEKAVKHLDRLGAAGVRAGRSGTELGDSIEKGAEKASGSLLGLSAVAMKTLKVVGMLAGVTLGTGLIAEVGRMADAWSDMTSRVRLSIGAHENAAGVMGRLATIARQTYSSLELTAESFTRNATTLNALGKSTAQQLDYAQALNNALVVSGAKADRAVMVQNSLAKAMAEGTLRGEEFNNVINYGSRVAELLATELGVNVTELRKLAADGKITGDVIFGSLVKNMQSLTEQAESMPATIGDAFTLLRNSVLKSVGAFDQQNKLSESFAEKLIVVADHMDEVMRAAKLLAGVLATVWGTRMMAMAAAYTAQLVAQAKQYVINIALARELGIAQNTGFLASIKSIGKLNALLGTLGAALAGWQIGTYLREEFLEVKRFGIAMVGGLLKAWESLKFYSTVLWEGVKASAIGALNVVRTAAANMIGALAKVNEATDVFGIKSGVTDSLRKMEGQIRPTSSAWDGFAAAVGTAAKQMLTNNAAIDESMMALWESAGAAEAADEASGNLGKTLTGTGAAAKEAASATENLYTHTTRLGDATGDVDNMLRSLAYGLADEGTRALMDYEDVQARILELEMAWLDLGPMSEAQIAKIAELRRLAAEGHARNMADLNDETVRDAQRAAQESARAWEDFTGSLADAVLDGSSGVKRWWKAMIDDMKRQFIQSGLLKIFGSIFNIGGAQAGSGFGSMFAAMLGGGAQVGRAASMGGVGFGQILQLAGGGSTGGSVLSGLAGAISNGISGGLISLGGTLAGGGGMLGSMGTGLMQAGGFINQYGLLGGLGKGLTGGLSTMFGGGGFMAGLGQMIPAIAAIAGVAAAIQKISGGKLFGTKYQFDSANRTIDFTGAGVGGQDSLTEVRQRSLFRGRKWRTTNTALDAEIVGPLEEFWNAIMDANSEIARTFGREAAIDVPASFRQEFNAKGDVTAEIGTILGKTYRETWEVFAKRISAENIIANIDGMLGTLVSAPIFGGGGGGGPPGRGGDSTIVAGLGGAIPMDVQAQVGEASAIAERWRDSAEALLDGAQFLLLAATDIHTGTGLLGEGGTLTQITDLIEDLQGSGESLSAAYARVAGSAALLDQALALSGVQIDGTREHIVRLATAITDAAGGLERAGALWGAYFDRFYTDAERAQYVLTQAQTSAAKEFGDIGLEYTDFTGEGGTQAFRKMFEDALPTLSAEAIVEWLEAAAALGIVIDATEALNVALGEVDDAIAVTAEQLADRAKILADIGSAIEDFGLSEWERQLKAIDTQQQQYIKSLMDTGMTLEDATAATEAWRTAAREAAEAQRQSQRTAILGGIDSAIEDFGLSEWERQLKDIETQTQSYIDSLVDTGMSLEDATAAAQRWGDAARGVAEAQRLAAEAVALLSLNDWGADLRAATGELSVYGKAMHDAERWREKAIEEANRLARAAGLAGARVEDLASIELRHAQMTAEAARVLENSARGLISQLYGPTEGSLDDILAQIAAMEASSQSAFDSIDSGIQSTMGAWLDGLRRVRGFLDSMLLDSSTTTLTPEEQLDEAMAQFNHLLGLANAGDADALSELPGMAQTVLDLARAFWSSGDEYTAIFDGIRAALQGLPASGGAGGGQPGGGGGGQFGVSPELQALYEERDRLLAEQEAANRLQMAQQLAAFLVEMAKSQEQPILDLARALGVRLEDFVTDLGVDLSNVSVATVQQLADLARMLGVSLSDLAGSVGVSIGSLTDQYSLAAGALAEDILKLPVGIRDGLQPYLDAIAAATNDADASAATEAMAEYVSTLDADIRNQLAPYFEGLQSLTSSSSSAMDEVAANGRDILSMAVAQVDLLQRIADNLGAANSAAGVPSYAVGVGTVPNTGLAMIHQGETIIPAQFATWLRSNGFPLHSSGGYNDDLVEALIGEMVELRAEVRAGADRTAAAARAAGDKVGERIDHQTNQDGLRNRELITSISRRDR